jgi:hypothetical protein
MMRLMRRSVIPVADCDNSHVRYPMRSEREEELLRRARRLVDLGDQLQSIREEVEKTALDIYDEVGEGRGDRRDLVEDDDNGGGGVSED